MNHLGFDIVGAEIALPANKVPSSQIDQEFELPIGTVEQESGVEYRYRANREDTPVSLGAMSARKALEKAVVDISEVNLIIYAGASPSQPVPCNAVLLHRELKGSRDTTCFDIDQTCMSFATALKTVNYFVNMEESTTALIVCSEIASRHINRKDLKTYGLFGDASVSFLIQGFGASKILDSTVWTMSEHADACKIVGGGLCLPAYEYDGKNKDEYLFHMDGPTLFKVATMHLPELVSELLKQNDLTLEDIKLVIPHQASLGAMRLIQRRLKIRQDKCMEIIQKYGNCVAASMPMALQSAISEKRLQSGDIALLIGAGAGVTLGATLVQI